MSAVTVTGRADEHDALRIGEVVVGGGAPLALFAGLNVVENLDATLSVARELGALAARYEFPLVFKASVDKANRSSRDAYRGPGFDEGLRVLARVRAETGLPLTTDIHEPAQAKAAAEVVDCLQIPAFLCRQTDLLVAAAATGRPLNIKRAQFVAPEDMRFALEKVRAQGGAALLTERGSVFGYRDLVVDMRGLLRMRRFAPVCFDATHAVQQPGANDGASGGEREMVTPLARAAVAVGVDALFIEVHPTPERAPCDGPSQIDFSAFENLLREVRAIEKALGR